MPKKGSRVIAVKGKNYRYMVKPMSGVNDTVVLTVQEDTKNPGRVFRHYIRGSSIHPSDVMYVIIDALNKGWNSSERGGPWPL